MAPHKTKGMILQSRRARIAESAARRQRLEQDPAVQLCRAERARANERHAARMAAAQAEFVALVARLNAENGTTRKGRPRGRPLRLPTAPRKKA